MLIENLFNPMRIKFLSILANTNTKKIIHGISKKVKATACFYISIYLTVFILTLPINVAFAKTTSDKTNVVNVISWWGYLEDPKIKKIIKTQCNTNFSVDTYYSSNEFMRRFKSNKSNYDIAIFSDTIYNLVKDQLPSSNIDLTPIALNFNPYIRKHYFKEKMPKNIIYFMHSLTGFLWNPKVINLSKTDTINAIFAKVGTNIVVIVDDPVEVWNLINRANYNSNTSWVDNPSEQIALSEESFNNLVKNANIYITNNYNQLYDQPNFAFSFAWSGDSIVYMKQAKKTYNFLIYPRLSYISSDLLVTLNSNQKTACVAKVLLSKEILDIVANYTYYVTPYVDKNSVNDPTYQKAYASFFDDVGNYSWLTPVSQKNYNDILNVWSEIQINQNNHN